MNIIVMEAAISVVMVYERRVNANWDWQWLETVRWRWCKSVCGVRSGAWVDWVVMEGYKRWWLLGDSGDSCL